MVREVSSIFTPHHINANANPKPNPILTLTVTLSLTVTIGVEAFMRCGAKKETNRIPRIR